MKESSKWLCNEVLSEVWSSDDLDHQIFAWGDVASTWRILKHQVKPWRAKQCEASSRYWIIWLSDLGIETSIFYHESSLCIGISYYEEGCNIGWLTMPKSAHRFTQVRIPERKPYLLIVSNLGWPSFELLHHVRLLVWEVFFSGSHRSD
jgi:hypothetical protein